MPDKKSQLEEINRRWNDPFKISAVAGVLAVLLILGGTYLGKDLTMEDESRFPWILSSSTILLYSLFNTVGLLMTDDTRRYWSRSLYGFIALLALVFLLSWLATGVSIYALGNFKSVLFVLVIAYIVLMTIGNTVRWIVAVTVDQDRKKLDKENREKNN